MLPAKTSDSATLAAPKLLDRVRGKIRLKNYSIRTEQAYTDWIRRFILFHGKRHPGGMGAAEVEAFLTHLEVEGKVAASLRRAFLLDQTCKHQKLSKAPAARAIPLRSACRPSVR